MLLDHNGYYELQQDETVDVRAVINAINKWACRNCMKIIVPNCGGVRISSQDVAAIKQSFADNGMFMLSSCFETNGVLKVVCKAR